MKQIAAIILLLLAQYSTAQQAKYVNSEGWEFLSWDMSRGQTELILQDNGIYYREMGDELQITYNSVRTNLIFDEINLLQRIELATDYSVAQLEQSEIYYQEQKEMLTLRYGRPDSIKKDYRSKVNTLYWELPHSTILMIYDYRYKIVDEMGGSSYTVDVIYSRK